MDHGAPGGTAGRPNPPKTAPRGCTKPWDSSQLQETAKGVVNKEESPQTYPKAKAGACWLPPELPVPWGLLYLGQGRRWGRRCTPPAWDFTTLGFQDNTKFKNKPANKPTQAARLTFLLSFFFFAHFLLFLSGPRMRKAAQSQGLRTPSPTLWDKPPRGGSAAGKKRPNSF